MTHSSYEPAMITNMQQHTSTSPDVRIESSGWETIKVFYTGSAAVLILNRPHSLNALSCAMHREIKSAFEEFSDKSVRAVIITGADRPDGRLCFCAGADLKDGSLEESVELAKSAFLAVERYPGVVIAAIGGLALGGGLELALACDFRIVGAVAKLGLPEINIASMPRAGGTQRLARLIGEARAKELLYTGEQISGDRAAVIGLATTVVPAGQELNEAILLAERLAQKAPLALAAIKQAVTLGRDLPLEEALALEIKIGRSLDLTEDRIEGRRAFLEKRAPRFVGQ